MTNEDRAAVDVRRTIIDQRVRALVVAPLRARCSALASSLVARSVASLRDQFA